MSSFDKDLATAELSAFEILATHHARQISIARDRKTCLLFATKLGTLANMFSHAAGQMRKERLCECGTIVENGKLGTCPSCGKGLRT